MKSAEQQLATFLARYAPDIQATARSARRKMRAMFPRAIELVYDNYNALVIGYGPTERAGDAICSIAVYPRWVTLFFLHGAKLRDPQKLLTGSGKIVRGVRLSAADDLDKPAIRALVKQATEASEVPFTGRGLVIKSISTRQRPRRAASGVH